MLRTVLAGAVAAGLCGPAAAQHWVPPRPGQSTCSGWDTPEARQDCEAREGRQRASAEAARQAEQDRTRAIVDAEGKRIAAERAAAEAARQKAAAQAAEERQAQVVAEAEEGAKAEALARSFEFGADEFGGLLARVGRARGQPLAAKLLSCSQPGAGREGECDYEAPPGVGMTVSSRPDTFRAERVTVTWDGSPQAMGPFARRVVLICRALAPSDHEEEAIARAGGQLGSIGATGEWGEKRWTSGRVGYVIRPDPKLGARGAAVFEAEDLGD